MQAIITRLKKIEGQIQGLQKMIERKDSCEKVMVQFQASLAALQSVYSLALSENLEQCMKTKDAKTMQKIVSQLAKR